MNMDDVSDLYYLGIEALIWINLILSILHLFIIGRNKKFSQILPRIIISIIIFFSPLCFYLSRPLIPIFFWGIPLIYVVFPVLPSLFLKIKDMRFYTFKLIIALVLLGLMLIYTELDFDQRFGRTIQINLPLSFYWLLIIIALLDIPYLYKGFTQTNLLKEDVFIWFFLSLYGIYHLYYLQTEFSHYSFSLLVYPLLFYILIFFSKY